MNRRYFRARRKAGVMNGLEASYARRLEEMKLTGEIEAYWFEDLGLKLAPKTFYYPDYLVMTREGILECHEVKPATNKKNKDGLVVGAKAFATDDATVKLKVAAAKFPFRFIRAYPTHNGWIQEVIGPDQT